ncbi:hypothetical protein F5X68DRAFT_177667 [Plectosphaerella plurivora]|uniref:RGS domain-containing protein n=1 Tax=Plectosphaerella plurivora TaxID=936078 RepID=A0A9P9A3M7_9PEZI|nr:hypothetical protein F5X68DRAFT_177667 [Plectosphaerella plurivora]
MSVNLDGVGIFWAVFAASWTLILMGGMSFIYSRRDMSMLRIRGLPLSFAAIALLHVYWVAVQLGYIYGHLVAPGIEYWIMGIYLPFGIALFHASNSRFLHVAKAQKIYATSGRGVVRRQQVPRSRWSLVNRWRRYDYATKMLTVIFMGMSMQFVLTLVMYLVSRKFHPSFGIPGTEVTGTPAQQAREQGRGWEWWPTIFWQVLWAWIVAPIILWRSRKIHDTQGWRVQTILCCLVSLPAAPMWIVALNVDAMAVVNKYFVPPQWICVSIMLLEIFTVFIPCWKVFRHRSLHDETLQLIAQWESERGYRTRNTTVSGKPTVSGSTRRMEIDRDGFVFWRRLNDVGDRTPSFDTAAVAGSGLLTMNALEYALKRNPDPLQHFSALKDFSGENIAFLTAVSRWKTAMRAGNVAAYAAEDRNGISQVTTPERRRQHHDQEREHFNQALRIYTDYVSRSDAEFSINISSTDLRKVEAVFEEAARQVHGVKKDTSNAATPFEDWTGPRRPCSASGESDKGIVLAGVEPVNGERSSGSRSGAMDSASTLGEGGYFWGDIPDGFDETVFDDAEMSIKYLVLTNTWPKFVKARRTSLDSTGSTESYDTLMDMVVRREQPAEGV